MDKIFIKKLKVRSSLTSGPKPIYQPILLSVSIPTDVTAAAIADDVALSINYASLTATIRKACDEKSFHTLFDLVNTVASIYPSEGIDILAEQPRGHFRAESIGIKVKHVKSDGGDEYAPKHMFFINNLELATVIGINPEERNQKQPVTVDIKYASKISDLAEVASFVSDLVESSNFLTVESITLHIVASLQKSFDLGEITVAVTKPKALTFGNGAGVQVTRQGNTQISKPFTTFGTDVVAYIAFGSNVEPRIDYITKALNIIKASIGVTLLDTSFLYESHPMYYESQATFYNGAIKVSTTLSPVELLTLLKQIECQVGRIFRFQNGPREVDLDILFYSHLQLSTDDLTIPHPRIFERGFVLRPLLDLYDPLIGSMLQLDPEALSALLPKSKFVRKVLPILRQGQPSSSQLVWNSKTFIMGILNISPDSFSEPGITDPEVALGTVKRMEGDGVDVIDIGAVSRKPGATEDTSTEEETMALTTLIRLIRQSGTTIPISVETFKATVAEAAIDAGADMINNIGPGRDPNLIKLAAQKNFPIILMHTRGTPADMHLYTDYEQDDVTGKVIKELDQVAAEAVAAGVFRWNVILDPGIGFAKTGAQNLRLLQTLPSFRVEDSPLRGYPLLIGCSRKKFIGALSGVEAPTDRGPGTMASTAASISAGADIIRVHDVKENVQVAKFSDAVWRH